jgi:predicted membrane protein (TIGR00267 family)
MNLKGDPIIRRLFVLNSFDGILTVLGIVVGSLTAGVGDARVVLMAGIGATIAMGISGFSGAYMTEYAERKRVLHKLERKMLLRLEKTVHGQSVGEMSFLVAVVDGLAPFGSGLTCLVPFLLAALGLIHITYSYLSSVLISLIIISVLGGFLGVVSKENVLVYAVKMLGIGILTFLIIFALGLGGFGF